MRASWIVWDCLLGVALLAIFIVGVSAHPRAHAPAAPVFPIPARVIEVKDGDTIEADLILPWSVTLRAQSIRENSFDAWESSKRRQSGAVGGEISDAEVVKGKLAKEFLKTLLERNEVFVEPTRNAKGFGDRDVYGRVLGKLWVARDGKWIDVGAEMISHGHQRK
jgi:endonuclease YncB( thermonuclease family)